MKKIQNRILLSLGLLLILLQPVSGEKVVQIPAGRDNTLFESATGTLSNGIGPNLFTGLSGGGRPPPQIKRALIWFDVAGNLPPGSTITSVTLKLSLLRTRDLSSRIVELRRVLQDWGEGTSNSGSAGGGGAPATTGDATWLHTFFNTAFWVNPGGDFSATVSAGQPVGTLAGDFTWGPTMQMVADVQSWLDDPNNNFGWSLLTDESVIQTARKFGSRENTTVANRPLLTIEYFKIGDLDDSGFINFADHALFANEFKATDCSALNDWCNRADMAPDGGDGIVDWFDFAVLVDVDNWLAGPPPSQASNPNPANDATDVDPNAELNWTAASDAISHDVYFGTSSPGTFQGNQAATTFDPGTMFYSSTYYWRIDSVNIWGTATGTVWSFTTIYSDLQASNPNPFDGETTVSTTADLSWTAGLGATSHDVYFGTSNPPPFQLNQTTTTFNPGTMAYSTTYYWRIDETGAYGTITGMVWSFSTVMPPPF